MKLFNQRLQLEISDDLILLLLFFFREITWIGHSNSILVARTDKIAQVTGGFALQIVQGAYLQQLVLWKMMQLVTWCKLNDSYH